MAHKKPTKAKRKFKKVLEEFKQGKLHSGSKKGAKVKNPKQALAIAFSESRKVGKKKSASKKTDAKFIAKVVKKKKTK